MAYTMDVIRSALEIRFVRWYVIRTPECTRHHSAMKISSTLKVECYPQIPEIHYEVLQTLFIFCRHKFSNFVRFPSRNTAVRLHSPLCPIAAWFL